MDNDKDKKTEPHTNMVFESMLSLLASILAQDAFCLYARIKKWFLQKKLWQILLIGVLGCLSVGAVVNIPKFVSYTIKNEFFKEEDAAPFNVSYEQSGEDTYDSIFILYNNTDNDFGAVGVQYMVTIKYDDVIMETLRINNVYSLFAYFYENENRSFCLKRNKNTGYEELRNYIEDTLRNELGSDNISTKKLDVETVTLCCARMADRENSPFYFLLYDDALTKAIGEDKVSSYLYGIDLPTTEEKSWGNIGAVKTVIENAKKRTRIYVR